MGSHYDDEELRKTVKFEEVDVEVDDELDNSASLLAALDDWAPMPEEHAKGGPFAPAHEQATRIARVPVPGPETAHEAHDHDSEGALICTGIVVSNGYIRIAAEVAAHLEEGEQLTVVLRRQKPKSQ